MKKTLVISGLPDSTRQCPVSHVQGVLFNDDLEEEKDALAPSGEMQTLDNVPLENFVFSDMPSIKLTPDLADNIDTDSFEETHSKVIVLMDKAKLDEEKMKDLQKQVIVAGKQNNFEKAFLHCL